MTSSKELQARMATISGGKRVTPNKEAWVPRHTRYSATTLGTAADCMLSARFKREADSAGPPAILGRICHEAFASLTDRAHMLGRTSWTAEEAVAEMKRLLRHPQEPEPLSAENCFDAIEMARRWAGRASFRPDADVHVVEALYEHPLGGVPISGRVDYLTVQGTVCEVDDWKTGRKMGPESDYDDWKKRPQLAIYAWHAWCEFPLCDTFICNEHFTRYGARRGYILGIEELLEIEFWLDAAVARLEKAWDEDDWPTTSGDHCAFCTLPAQCPLPRKAKPADIRNDDELATQVSALFAEEAASTQRKKAIKAYLDAHELPEFFVGQRGVGYKVGTSNNLDKKAVAAAGIDLDPFYESKPSRNFKTDLKGD